MKGEELLAVFEAMHRTCMELASPNEEIREELIIHYLNYHDRAEKLIALLYEVEDQIIECLAQVKQKLLKDLERGAAMTAGSLYDFYYNGQRLVNRSIMEDDGQTKKELDSAVGKYIFTAGTINKHLRELWRLFGNFKLGCLNIFEHHLT